DLAQLAGSCGQQLDTGRSHLIVRQLDAVFVVMVGLADAMRIILCRGGFRRVEGTEDVPAREGEHARTGDRDQRDLKDPYHLVRACATTAGRPIRPSMVASDVCNVAKASCSMSSASATRW